MYIFENGLVGFIRLSKGSMGQTKERLKTPALYSVMVRDKYCASG